MTFAIGWRRWLLTLVTTLATTLLLAPAAAAITETGTLGSAGPGVVTGTQTGRITNDGGASSCATPSSTSLLTGSRAFNAHDFFTGASAACVTVSLTTSCTQTQFVQLVAYLGSHDPANPLTNYLADYGTAVGGSVGGSSMSFNVPANSSFVVVVVENTPGQAVGCTYSIDVTGTGVTTPVTMRSASAARSAKGVTLRWQTASEISLLGFNVYREVDGKRMRVNRSLIACKGRGPYSFLDRKAPRAKTVRYWVQAVNLDGTRSWYGPARVARS